MKIALQIPNSLLRRARKNAHQRRLSLQLFVVEALTGKIGPEPLTPEQSRKARMNWAGALSHLREETARINAIIEAEFGRLD